MSTVFMHIIRVRTFKVQVKFDKLGTKKYNYKIKMKKKKEGWGGGVWRKRSNFKNHQNIETTIKALKIKPWKQTPKELKMKWLRALKEPNYKTNTTLMVGPNGVILLEIKSKKANIDKNEIKHRNRIKQILETSWGLYHYGLYLFHNPHLSPSSTMEESFSCLTSLTISAKWIHCQFHPTYLLYV